MKSSKAAFAAIIIAMTGAFAVAKASAPVVTHPDPENPSTEQSVGHTTLHPQLDGEWTIYVVNGERVTGEERPTITFAGDRFYGNNGCNVINGRVETGAANSIHLTDVITTMMYCPNAPFEHIINTTLDNVRQYKISQYGHEYYLDLMNQRGHTLMVLRKHNMDFLNGAWRVVKIDGEPNANEGVEIVIDIPEKHIHGNTGCNILNGEIFIDPDKDNSVQFSNIAVTMMMCPDMATETAFLVDLEMVERAFAIDNSTVRFYDDNGRELLEMRRLDIH